MLLPGTMLDREIDEATRIRPIRRVEYHRMVDLGMFLDERIELLRGVLVEMSPQKAPHAVAVERLNYLLLPAVGARGRVRIQLPLALSDDSEPEPDVAVVPPGDYSREHPTTALLIVEVSHESRRVDRGVKAALYAEAGIPEYWIADVVDSVLEIRARPVEGEYCDVARHDRTAIVTPIAFPDIRIAVADVLSPPQE